MVRPILAVACCLTTLVCGCAGPPRHELKPLPQVASLGLFDGHTGTPAPWRRLVSAAESADIVIIGERHGHGVGLHAAATLFEDVIDGAPEAALSMEFLERDEQLLVDDYLAGVIDEATFMKETGRTETGYPSGHRRMVDAAKDAGRPVYASNAPRRYVRYARTSGFEGFDGLTGEQRRMIVLPEAMIEGAYRDRFFELMGGAPGHGGGRGNEGGGQTEDERAEAERAAMEQIESFYRSQNVWDATMADTLVRALGDGCHPVVHVVGQFHSDSDGGLVQRVRAAVPEVRILTISVADAWSSVLHEDDAGRADYVIYAGPDE